MEKKIQDKNSTAGKHRNRIGTTSQIYLTQNGVSNKTHNQEMSSKREIQYEIQQMWLTNGGKGEGTPKEKKNL